MQDVGNRRDPLLERELVCDPCSGQRRAIRITDDDVEGRLTLAWEVGGQPVKALPRLQPRWQHVHVAVGQPQAQERRAGQEQKARRRDEDDQRPPHHPAGQPVPESAAR